MSDKKHTLREESKSFLEKYAHILPDTIYYKEWKNVIVEPNLGTINAIESLFKDANKDSLCIAEIGIGMAATTLHIAKFLDNKGELHIFDFNESVIPIKKMLSEDGFSNIFPHGSSFKKMDSYNWNLLFLLKGAQTPLFDYVFLDGAHSFPVDGLAFFLIDMLLKKGGYIDFDDYHWTHADHIKNSAEKYTERQQTEGVGSFMQRTLESFTPSQLKMKQVALIVDIIVAKTGRYKEIVPEKIYQKLA